MSAYCCRILTYRPHTRPGSKQIVKCNFQFSNLIPTVAQIEALTKKLFRENANFILSFMISFLQVALCHINLNCFLEKVLHCSSLGWSDKGLFAFFEMTIRYIFICPI